MDNIENNKNTIFYKNIVRNFNIVIGISFIMLVSIIYITSVFNVHIPQFGVMTSQKHMGHGTLGNFLVDKARNYSIHIHS